MSQTDELRSILEIQDETEEKIELKVNTRAVNWKSLTTDDWRDIAVKDHLSPQEFQDLYVQQPPSPSYNRDTALQDPNFRGIIRKVLQQSNMTQHLMYLRPVDPQRGWEESIIMTSEGEVPFYRYIWEVWQNIRPDEVRLMDGVEGFNS